MTPQPHWPWLHGPAGNPDPRVGDMSTSAANRHRYSPAAYIWDHWMNEPVREVQPREDDAA